MDTTSVGESPACHGSYLQEAIIIPIITAAAIGKIFFNSTWLLLSGIRIAVCYKNEYDVNINSVIICVNSKNIFFVNKLRPDRLGVIRQAACCLPELYFLIDFLLLEIFISICLIMSRARYHPAGTRAYPMGPADG
jgi:hypothetical protein